jgi:hypothetical protein
MRRGACHGPRNGRVARRGLRQPAAARKQPRAWPASRSCAAGQDSLGGNSRTLMIACVSPADVNFEVLSRIGYRLVMVICTP